MLQDFVRLAVYVPFDEGSQDAGLMAVTAVREILRTFREFDFAGSVGAYKAVAEISSGVETFVPTVDAAPTMEPNGLGWEPWSLLGVGRAARPAQAHSRQGRRSDRGHPPADGHLSVSRHCVLGNWHRTAGRRGGR